MTDQPDPRPDQECPGLRLFTSAHWRAAYLQALHEAPEEDRLSAETIATYEAKIELFLTWWHDYAAAHALTQAVAEAYQAWLLAEWQDHHRFTKRSYGLCLSGIRGWGTYLVDQHVLAVNPFHAVRGPKRMDSHASGFLMRPQAARLLASFDRTQLIEHRDYLLCLLMLTHGARETELAQATVGDLTDAELSLHSKGKKTPETVTLAAGVCSDLQAYLTHRRARGEHITSASPLLTTVRTLTPAQPPPMGTHEMRRRIRVALDRAGLASRHLSGLALRQTAAVQAFLDGVPIEEVQRMMRHADEKTTKIFKHRADRIRDGQCPTLMPPPRSAPS